MPLEPLQFIHTANLFLDRQLEETGPIPDEYRDDIVDASLTAFEEIIIACLEHQVDFLLLTGNSFIEADQSLRARVALLDGFRQLDEENIRVFIMPGEADPPQAWNAICHLPENVTVFRHRTEEPVAVVRAGRLIATIAQIHSKSPLKDLPSQPTHTSEDLRTTPFQIGVFVSAEKLFNTDHEYEEDQSDPEIATEAETDDLDTQKSDPDPIEFILNRFAFDYLAFDAQNRQQTIVATTSIAHSPGSPQGFHRQHQGERGCTLVNVNEYAEIETGWIPTSIVRYEQVSLDVETSCDREQLLKIMHETVRQRLASSTETILIIQWSIRGSNELIDTLREQSIADELSESLAAEDAPEDQTFVLHRIRLQSIEQTQPSVLDRNQNSLMKEYFELLQSGEPLSPDTLHTLIGTSPLPEKQWRDRLHSLSRKCNLQSVATQAEQLGIKWLIEAPPGKGSHETE